MFSTDIAYLLGTYDHEYTDEGVNEIDTVSFNNKTNLREHLSNSPYWDEKQQAIILKSEYSRDFDKTRINTFLDWLREVFSEMCQKTETNNEYERLSNELRYWRNRRFELGEAEPTYDVLLSRGEAYTEWLETKAKVRKIMDNARYAVGCYMSEEEYDVIDKYDKLDRVICCIRDIGEQLVSEGIKKIIEEKFPGVNCVVGQKCSKVVNAIAKLIGLSKHEEWNRKSAILFDGFNPLKYETYTIISINILDFLTMSFGKNWASCHTIDKHNYRNGPGNYGGCYCGGTISYGADTSTVILYTVDREYDNVKEMWKADKIRRCVFYISECGNVIVQSRVYPDGRDGGEKGIAAQFRAIMQDVVAQCWDIPNVWTLKTGTTNACRYIRTQGGSSHYHDYECYEDVNVSVNKNTDCDNIRIPVGHAIICPVCGEEHSNSEYLVCDDCREEHDVDDRECAYCHSWFSTYDDDAVQDEEDGEWYCCEDCAESHGVHYMSDADHWSSTEDYFIDNYDDRYYYTDNMAVETVDGNCYYTENHARCDGYVEAIDEYCDRVWISEDDAYWSEIEEEWYTYDYDAEKAEENNDEEVG